MAKIRYVAVAKMKSKKPKNEFRLQYQQLQWLFHYYIVKNAQHFDLRSSHFMQEVFIHRFTHCFCRTAYHAIDVTTYNLHTRVNAYFERVTGIFDWLGLLDMRRCIYRILEGHIIYLKISS